VSNDVFGLSQITDLSLLWSSLANAAKMPLYKDFIDLMNDGTTGRRLYNHMRVLIDMCVAISPVIAFYTQRFSNSLIRQDHLVAVSVHDHL
jgi:hypothetical protein